MKKTRNIALIVGAIAVLAVGSIAAYFTATDTATNNFEVEKVDVQLTEPDYVDGTLITPNETIVKDPTVTNTGNTDEFVFVSVKVPFKNIVTAQLDGTKNAAADTELFTWNAGQAKGVINAAKGAGEGAVNDGWVLVKTNVLADQVEYIYAYGSANAMTALAPNASTVELFDSVTMCNAVEGQGLEESQVEIGVDVYAIQKSDLNGGTVVPAEVLAIYLNQNK